MSNEIVALRGIFKANTNDTGFKLHENLVMPNILLLLLLLFSCSGLYKNSPLIESVTKKKETIGSNEIEKIIDRGKGDANEQYGGGSVLLYAMANIAPSNKMSVVRTLLENGADINFSAQI